MKRIIGAAACLAAVVGAGAAFAGPIAANDQPSDSFPPVSIYFRPGATGLTKEAGAMLDQMAAAIKAAHAGRLIINGYASDGSSATDDQHIAEARADAVEQRLIANGVSASTIHVGTGQSAALARTNDAPAFIADRRTDIIVVPASSEPVQF